MLNYQRVDRNWWKLYVCHFWDTPLRFPCRNNQVQKCWDFHLVEIGVFRKWNGFVALDCWVPNDIQPTQKWVGCARMLFFFVDGLWFSLVFPSLWPAKWILNQSTSLSLFNGIVWNCRIIWVILGADGAFQWWLTAPVWCCRFLRRCLPRRGSVWFRCFLQPLRYQQRWNVGMLGKSHRFTIDLS